MKNCEPNRPPWSLEWTGIFDLVLKGQILPAPPDMQHEALRDTSKSQRSGWEQQPVVDPNSGLVFVKEAALNKHLLFFPPDVIAMRAVVMEVRPDTFSNMPTHFLLLIPF